MEVETKKASPPLLPPPSPSTPYTNLYLYRQVASENAENAENTGAHDVGGGLGLGVYGDAVVVLLFDDGCQVWSDGVDWLPGLVKQASGCASRVARAAPSLTAELIACDQFMNRMRPCKDLFEKYTRGAAVVTY